MALSPDVQKKAQRQLDRVVGSTRLPDFDDIMQMPYIQALAMETLRWMPVAPFGIPHAVTADDVYNGYHISKGTVLVPVSSLTFTKAWSVKEAKQGPVECLVCPQFSRYISQGAASSLWIQGHGS